MAERFRCARVTSAATANNKKEALKRLLLCSERITLLAPSSLLDLWATADTEMHGAIHIDDLIDVSRDVFDGHIAGA